MLRQPPPPTPPQQKGFQTSEQLNVPPSPPQKGFNSPQRLIFPPNQTPPQQKGFQTSGFQPREQKQPTPLPRARALPQEQGLTLRPAQQATLYHYASFSNQYQSQSHPAGEKMDIFNIGRWST